MTDEFRRAMKGARRVADALRERRALLVEAVASGDRERTFKAAQEYLKAASDLEDETPENGASEADSGLHPRTTPKRGGRKVKRSE